MFRDLAELTEGTAPFQRQRDRIVERCLPLADHIARRFDGRGEPRDDLVQVARVGLVNAVIRFDVGLSANYRRVVANLPPAERDGWFQRFRRFPPSPVTIQAQAIAGDRGALGAVARDASHVKWSGRIEMVREGGAWKLADERWSSEPR